MAEQTTDLIQTITLERLRELLQRFGYRAELVTAEAQKTTFLRSATAGMAFDIRPGNRLPGDTAAFADFSFLALFTIKGGELPWALVNNWNNQRRFGRLHIDQGFLMLDMDVSVTGGVRADHLSAQFAIWDQLLQGLITYLRTELPRFAANGGASVPALDATAPAEAV
jgi:hypothetical protein